MTKKELLEELELRHMGKDTSDLFFQAKTVSMEDLIKRLKNLHADLNRVLNAPLSAVVNDIETIVYNLMTEIDELEINNEIDPKPVKIDNVREVWIDHEPVIVFSEE